MCGENFKLGERVEIVGIASRIKIGDNVSNGDGARLVCTDIAAEIIIGDGTVIQPRAILDTGDGGLLS